MDFDAIYKEYTRSEHLMRTGGKKGRLSPPESIRARMVRKRARARILGAVRKPFPLPDLRTEGDPRIVVSLTSFPRRIGGLPLMLRSVFMQDTLPGQIMLWLCEDEFAAADRGLTILDEFRQKGLRVEFVPEDFKPHLKYFHAFGSFPDQAVITLDDDLIYPPDTLAKLVATSRLFPQAVVANRTRRITLSGGSPAPYADWPNHTAGDQAQCSHALIALGYGGVLYPAGRYRTRMLDSDLFTRLSPRADDLWLKAVELASDIPVATPPGSFVHPVTVPGSQAASLLEGNLTGSGNDRQWNALDRHFDLTARLKTHVL